KQHLAHVQKADHDDEERQKQERRLDQGLSPPAISLVSNVHFMRSVSVRSFVWPAATVPKLSDPGVISIDAAAAATPVPLSDTVLGDVGSLLLIVSVPLEFPLQPGA